MAGSSAMFNLEAVARRLAEDAERWLAGVPLFAVALVVVLLAWFVGGWLSHRNALDHVARRNPFLRDLVRTSVRWLITLLGAVVALEILNATAMVGAILGTAGVLGVALGFAFKDILENYLAGVLMSLRQPFAPRDHVVIDGDEGIIVALTSRATILMTLDGNHVRIPNAVVFRSVALNYTRNPSRRFEVDVGVGVNEDLAHAQHVGTEALARVPGVIAKPPPRASVIALGDWNVQVRYFGWVDQRSHEFLLVKSEATRRVKEALGRAGVEMPEPIYRVNMETSAAPQESGKSASPTPRPPAPAIDTRSTRDLVPQLEHEESKRGRSDLLDPDAPQE
ncbi:mechanosensitive ion channel domain-containing protein [Lysobacter korlensis]|uniref:Small-conductance mechanosensitive channel n=1 Tax=Lysobacter korlensis TaxID=553636 RepID=A0ABV6RLF4_9GAMM